MAGKQKNKKMGKGTRGITLIALVVTIVLNAYRVVKRRKNFDKI